MKAPTALTAPLGTVWLLRTDLHDLTAQQIWESIGFIPYWLNPEDERSADDQLEAEYGSWDPLDGCGLGKDGWMTYPGDPPLKPLATCYFRPGRVTVTVFECDWVGILDESKEGPERFECARMT